MQEVIYKYFKDDRVAYFSPPDLIAANHYMRYEHNSGVSAHSVWERVILSVGSDDGEVQLFVCHTPEELEEKIKAIIR